MAIDPFVKNKAMTALLYQGLSDRKTIDRHMINNVKMRARKKIKISLGKE